MSWYLSGDDRGDQGVDPHPVPAGMSRVVRAVLVGFHGLPGDPLLVAWDDRREAVRLSDGRLQWYLDEARQAFPRDGRIVTTTAGVYPRGNRFMDALAVRSLSDLMEIVNAEEATEIDPSGLVRLRGEQDRSTGTAVLDEDTGIISRASGVHGSRPWTIEVLASRLVPGGELLVPADPGGALSGG